MNPTLKKGVEGLIFSIQRYSLHDGPGIRTIVFFKGCNLRCLWCHNPESQSAVPELMIYPDKCRSCGACTAFCSKAFTDACSKCGSCASVCRYGARDKCGRKENADDVFDVILKDRDYYEVSGGGVTLSGGEPLLQPEFSVSLLEKCRENGIHTAVETAGNVPSETLERIMPLTDLFLYDIKCIDTELHKSLTGVSNDLILSNSRLLKNGGAEVIFRMPVVPGFNDSEIGAVSEFVGNGKLELMPYHNICSAKYNALGREFKTRKADVPSDDFIRRLAQEYPNVINRL